MTSRAPFRCARLFGAQVAATIALSGGDQDVAGRGPVVSDIHLRVIFGHGYELDPWSPRRRERAPRLTADRRHDAVDGVISQREDGSPPVLDRPVLGTRPTATMVEGRHHD